VVGLLAGSLLLLAVAPAFIPDSYNWVAQTTSEAAGQGVANAWIARTGFLFLGAGVILLAGLAGRRWGVAGRIVFRLYGVGMLATAVYSNKPWEDIPYVEFEDVLHSWASGVVGVSFICGVLVVMLRRPLADRARRALDWGAIGVAVGGSVLVFSVPDLSGAAQRAMFLVAYAWFAGEALKSAVVDPHDSEAMAQRMAE